MEAQPSLAQGITNMNNGVLTSRAPVKSVRSMSTTFTRCLLEGQMFKKPKSSFAKAFSSTERYVWSSPSLDTLMWGRAKNERKSHSLAASTITSVEPKNTGSKIILIVTPTETLELECESDDMRDEWLKIFTYMKELNSLVSRPFNVQHQITVNSDFKWELAPGQSIKSIFELGELLGQGTFGKVVRAKHISSGLSLAVKLVDVSGISDVSDMKREVDVLKECRFKNIVDFFGCWGPDEDNNLWALMNHCQFGSVIDLLARANAFLSESQISYVIASTLQGLHYLHKHKNIIHRDVKARNILIEGDGTIKLTDFGISKKAPAHDGHGLGTIGTGSPHWMAPEVVQDHPATYKSDIWSLGITAIELTIGLPPRADDSIYQVMSSTVTLPSPGLPPTGMYQGDDRPPWSREFHDFVARCLQKNPDARPSTTELLMHPFVMKGFQDPRILHPVLSLVETPKDPRDNQNAVLSSPEINSHGNGGNGSHEPLSSHGHGNNHDNSNSSPGTRPQSPLNASSTGFGFGGTALPSNSTSASISASAPPVLEKDAFDTELVQSSFSSSLSIVVPPRILKSLPDPARARLMEYCQPPFVDLILGKPHLRGNTLTQHSSYPIRVRTNSAPDVRQCTIIVNPSDPHSGSAILQRVIQQQETLVVWRRFSDFLWFHDTVMYAFPGVLIPMVPEKTISNRFDDAVLMARRQDLQWLLEYIARHPILSKTFLFHNFITLDDARFSEFKKTILSTSKNNILRKIFSNNGGQDTPATTTHSQSYGGQASQTQQALTLAQQGANHNRTRSQFLDICEPLPDRSLFSRLRQKISTSSKSSSGSNAHPELVACENASAYTLENTKYLSQMESIFREVQDTLVEHAAIIQQLGIISNRAVESALQGRKLFHRLLIQASEDSTVTFSRDASVEQTPGSPHQIYGIIPASSGDSWHVPSPGSPTAMSVGSSGYSAVASSVPYAVTLESDHIIHQSHSPATPDNTSGGCPELLSSTDLTLLPENIPMSHADKTEKVDKLDKKASKEREKIERERIKLEKNRAEKAEKAANKLKKQGKVAFAPVHRMTVSRTHPAPEHEHLSAEVFADVSGLSTILTPGVTLLLQHMSREMVPVLYRMSAINDQLGVHPARFYVKLCGATRDFVGRLSSYITSSGLTGSSGQHDTEIGHDHGKSRGASVRDKERRSKSPDGSHSVNAGQDRLESLASSMRTEFELFKLQKESHLFCSLKEYGTSMADCHNSVADMWDNVASELLSIDTDPVDLCSIFNESMAGRGQKRKKNDEAHTNTDYTGHGGLGHQQSPPFSSSSLYPLSNDLISPPTGSDYAVDGDIFAAVGMVGTVEDLEQ